jgi:3-oxoadipate enol-lactonase / 4-carboxymuconolactone decarboxylase
MPFAVSDGCRIYYRLDGPPDRPLLVLVHALGTDHGLWDPQMPALIRHFQVLRVDLRGHGASDAPPGEYSMALLARDILAAVPRERFSYCGLSLGGMIGQRIAADHPTRVERLVLANTSARAADPSAFEARRQTVLEQGMGAVEAAVMQRFFSARPNPWADSIRAVFRATDPVGYAACCSAIRDMDHRPLLPSIAASTLVIGSDEDASTPWTGHADALVSAIPGARGVKLAAAHLSNLERPAGFTRAMLEFLLPAAPDSLDAGFAIRRAVLGDAHVDRAIANTTDFTRSFQEFITRSVWGAVWTRPGLDTRTRRLLVLAVTASMGRWEEFRLHVRSGLAAGIEPEELEEVLLQTGAYAGVPAANSAFQIAKEELKGGNS